jgi:spermidine synthase
MSSHRRHALNLAIVGLSAACGLVVEIVAGRMVAPYLGMSLYTWTAIIAVVLAGFSLGHWIGGLIAGWPTPEARRGVAWSLVAAAISTAASLVLIRHVAPAAIALDMGAVPTVLAVTLLLFFLPSFFVGIPSPVLTKLAIDVTEPQHTGRTIGAFYATGAIGSILGTLVAGFVFIAWLGSTITLVITAAIYLVMGLVLFATKEAGGLHAIKAPLGVAILGLLLVGYFGRQVQAFTDPCQVASSYYCIRVVDVSREFGEPARAMVLDHLGHGINLRDAPRRLVSPYVEMHDILARLHIGRKTPFRAFFVGGGAYTLPRAWSIARPDAEITVAEIDPAVTRAAVDHLWVKLPHRIRPVHQDARVALARTAHAHFDVIVGDAFHDIVIPPHLVTREFFALVAARLDPSGIYLMNVVDHRARPRLALSIRATLLSAFPTVEIWQMNASESRSTFVLSAVRRPTPHDRVALNASPGVVFQRLDAKRLATLQSALKPIVLTDDFAPVDRLIGVE